jgi:predicted nucleic acid-binding protein
VSVVDSSGWIEFLVDGPNADAFESQLESDDGLAVPTIILTEVGRWLLSHQRRAEVDATIALMQRGRLVPLDFRIARSAADLGVRHRLPLADSIIYATARSLDVELWSQDKDFDGLPGVRYVPKASP